jgi:hypothetical protein
MAKAKTAEAQKEDTRPSFPPEKIAELLTEAFGNLNKLLGADTEMSNANPFVRTMYARLEREGFPVWVVNIDQWMNLTFRHRRTMGFGSDSDVKVEIHVDHNGDPYAKVEASWSSCSQMSASQAVAVAAFHLELAQKAAQAEFMVNDSMRWMRSRSLAHKGFRPVTSEDLLNAFSSLIGGKRFEEARDRVAATVRAEMAKAAEDAK